MVDLTVNGCVPNPEQDGELGDGGSGAIRIDDGAIGVTVKNVTIRDSTGINRDGLTSGCYGILVHGANGSKILGNDIAGTGSGIYFYGGGKDAKVEQNNVHDNAVLIRNTPGGDDDYGANGITFANLQAKPGPTATKEHDHRQRRAVRGLRVRRRGVRGLQLVEREDHEQHDQGQRGHAGDGHGPENTTELETATATCSSTTRCRDGRRRASSSGRSA